MKVKSKQISKKFSFVQNFSFEREIFHSFFKIKEVLRE